MPDDEPPARPARPHRAPVIQTCGRCGLVLKHRAAWMQMTFCPRCIHASHVVRLTPVEEEATPQQESQGP